jgi:outer membrane protein OmpA-like peptidoglycan-associated protein
MKKIILLSITLATLHGYAQLGSMIKSKVQGRVQNEESNQMDKGLDKAENGIKDSFKKKKKSGTDSTASSTTQSSSDETNVQGSQVATTKEPATFKTYQNYDFVPGDKIIFDDNFVDDQDGEFPAHWKLVKGQAIVNKVEDKPSFLLTEGNYAVVTPRVKNEKYLPADFTVEFDFIFKKGQDGGYGYNPQVEFYYTHEGGYETSFNVGFAMNEVHIGDFSKRYPDELEKNFGDKWHHAAIILKNGQMKAYVDQYRICVNPNIEQKPYRLAFDGIGDENRPIIFTNVKIAEGGGMNLIGKKFTDAKIVTHGITFDVNKATIKPESMGTLNMITKVMTENPDVKFEIGGHTDSDGSDADNLKLSQARAEAVKTQLVSMGIDASRLTTKGYGESKPVGENTTPEGKANNRRVEFVKL